MERLTKRLSSGAPTYNYPASCYFDDDSGPDKIAQSAFRQRCVERLADYEDTERYPEEVSTLVKDWIDLCTIVGECGGISRVRELAAPAADVAPVVHGRCPICSGRKILTQDCDNGYSVEVDAEQGDMSVWEGDTCLTVISIDYCPNCGAKMDGGDSDALNRR